MTMKRTLQTILAIAPFGLAFSGYLTYQDLFATARAASCPSIGRPGTVSGYLPRARATTQAMRTAPSHAAGCARAGGCHASGTHVAFQRLTEERPWRDQR
jgi:hypothetical protein